MKNKTALEELIEQIEEEFNLDELGINPDEYLEKEKEQIIEAYKKGGLDVKVDLHQKKIFKNSEQYYKETYNK